LVYNGFPSIVKEVEPLNVVIRYPVSQVYSLLGQQPTRLQVLGGESPLP
jgi:hypothetical protein